MRELFVLGVAWAVLTAVCMGVGLPLPIAGLAGVVGCLGGVAASEYGSWRLVVITAVSGGLMWLLVVSGVGR